MHLATIRPTQPAPAWAVATTGKFPQVNGVRSAATYSFGAGNHVFELLPDLCFARALVHLGLVDEHLNLSTALRARPVWQIPVQRVRTTGSDHGAPLDEPCVRGPGFLVSDRAHTAIEDQPRAVGRVRVSPRRVRLALGVRRGAEAPSIDRPQSTLIPSGCRAASARATRGTRAIAGDLEARFEPHVRAVRFDGIDQAGHYYLRFAQPRTFGDVSDEERRRLGMVLDQQYAAIDREIGERLASMGPEDVLFVVSAFGMEPVSVGKRLLARAPAEPASRARTKARPTGFRSRTARGCARRGCRSGRSPTSRRRCCTCWGCPSAATCRYGAHRPLHARVLADAAADVHSDLRP